MIKVDHLTYDYPGKRALDDISFEIKEASITALVGPNGSGKTTLMKNLVALTKPVKGSILMNGIDIIENPKACHNLVGYLPDFFGLYNNLTVKQALTLALLSHNANSENPEQEVILLAEKLGLIPHIKKHVKELSRGLYQRVAIGQSIIHNPKILILDEPASGLDPEARHELSNLLKELNRDGVTIVVSSHILSELEEYCSDILIIKNGKIVDQKTINSIAYDKQYRRMVIDTVVEVEGLNVILDSFIKVDDVQQNGKTATFIFAGEEEDKAQILKELIEKGIPISNFTQEQVNIQNYYINKSKSVDHE